MMMYNIQKFDKREREGMGSAVLPLQEGKKVLAPKEFNIIWIGNLEYFWSSKIIKFFQLLLFYMYMKSRVQ